MRGALGFALATILLLGLLIMLAVIVDRHNPMLDLSLHQRNTLAPQTRAILGSLDRPVRALAFYKDVPAERVLLQDLFDRYRQYSRLLTLEFIDIDRRPELARAHQVTANQTVVLVAGELEVKTISPDEAALTGALVRVLEERPPRLAFLDGYGGGSIDDPSPAGIQQLAEMLRGQNFEVLQLVLAGLDRIPVEIDCAVLAAPEHDFTPHDADVLANFLLRGGRLLAMLEPMGDAGADSFLAEWGLIANAGIVVDPSPQRANIAGAGTELIALGQVSDAEHPILRGFTTATLYPIARSLEVVQPPAAGLTPSRLVATHQVAWLERQMEGLGEEHPVFDPGADLPGPLGLAYAQEVDLRRYRYGETEKDVGISAIVADLHEGVTDVRDPSLVDSTSIAGEGLQRQRPERTRLVAVGDVDFVNNANLLVRGNGDLLLAMALWLTERENRIALPPRASRADPILLSQRQKALIRALGIGVGPGLLLLMSGWIVWQRRRWI